jgi:hypothetical protein
MKKVEMFDKYGNKKERCCCEKDPNPKPLNDNAPKIYAPKCYINRQGKLSRWSVLESAPEMVCKEKFKLITKIFYDRGNEKSMSCCLPEGSPEPDIEPEGDSRMFEFFFFFKDRKYN